MCTQFLDAGEYCEKCAKAIQTEEFVSVRSDKLNKREDAPLQMQAQQEELHPSRGKDKDKVYIWLGVGGATAMIFASLLLYAYPSLFAGSALTAERQSAQALEDCRLVFEEIGYLLELGQMPDDSLRCAGTTQANIVSRTRGVTRVSHPNPGVHGLLELYVTSEDHEVSLVRAGQG